MSGWAKEYTHPTPGEQTQHDQDWHQVLWPRRSVQSSFSRLSLASLHPCDTVVKCRSCAAPFAGLPDITGLVSPYKGLLSSEVMLGLQSSYCPKILPVDQTLFQWK